mmetsp:Transcript_21760/g.28167  ORF Transcript_21760/g.28167 Transcript_21760/m.28167 type:complete len:535 (+) Transcript_21760:71-1675(+)|eukprot:CAMPEP_0197319140 /NCGR_PEP_ID=MMETSP0891-20130614/53578_1 /TAXON_ID=44058 ORGANISM="Aureoumbra lagunensis, Strain CCMP1510" /NCGR_SAMPLE_ID=MMETSP0891 /ASSEMBLY_ACC=CAM_ASM_000534 /LENGTH=534 /DNA_ID=CAMNT_0042809917 /DNA_START=45 /DNA_END=1649 /DNA_ORIENTATION=+
MSEEFSEIVDRYDADQARILMETIGPRDYLLLVNTQFGEISEEKKFKFLCQQYGYALKALGSRRSRPYAAWDALNLVWRTATRLLYSENENKILVGETILELCEDVVQAHEALIAGCIAIRLARWDGAIISVSFLYRIIKICYAADVDLTQLLCHIDRFKHNRLHRYEKRQQKRLEFLKKRDVCSAQKEMSDSDFSDSIFSASSSSSSSSDADSDSSSDSSSDIDFTIRKRRKVPWRWSATGVARLLARLDSLNALPMVWNSTFFRPKLASAAIRLCARTSARPDAQSVASDGILLLRRSAHFCPFPEIAIRRSLRIATIYLHPETRAYAQAAIREIFTNIHFDSALQIIDRVLFNQKLKNFAVGLDCLRILLLKLLDDTQRTTLDNRTAQILDHCLNQFIRHGQLGYDTLHANLEMHNATLTLSRMVVLLRNSYSASVQAIITKYTLLSKLCTTLQGRLRRPPAATRSPTYLLPADTIVLSSSESAPPATTNDGTSVVGHNKEENRFLLHLLVENLDYVLQDIRKIQTRECSY